MMCCYGKRHGTARVSVVAPDATFSAGFTAVASFYRGSHQLIATAYFCVGSHASCSCSRHALAVKASPFGKSTASVRDSAHFSPPSHGQQ